MIVQTLSWWIHNKDVIRKYCVFTHEDKEAMYYKDAYNGNKYKILKD